VTITSRRDINFALQTAMQRFSRELEAAERAGGGARLPPAGALPPLHLSALPVAAAPLPPADELGAEAPPPPPIDIDEWMLDM